MGGPDQYTLLPYAAESCVWPAPAGTVSRSRPPTSTYMARPSLLSERFFSFYSALILSLVDNYLKSRFVHCIPQFTRAARRRCPYALPQPALSGKHSAPTLGSASWPAASNSCFLTLANTHLHYPRILPQRRALVQSQGDSYHRYFEAVPSLWLSCRSRVPGSGPAELAGWECSGGMFFWLFARTGGLYRDASSLTYS